MSGGTHSAVAPQGSVAHVAGIPYSVEAIKRGGMGVVYVLSRSDGGDSIIHRRQIAAKIFDESGAGPSRESVKNELANWLSLKHPNVVELLAIGDFNFHLAALMPVAARSTDDIIRAGPIRLAAAISILRDALEGLHYAWSQHKLLHLDVKPGNLLVFGTTDSRRQVQVSDWGMSLIDTTIASTETKRKWGGGTIPYMAPERFFRDVEETQASDIFSLGITLIQLATGELPFDWKANVADQIVSGAYMPRALELLRRIGLYRRAQDAALFLIHPNHERRISSHAEAHEALSEIARNARWTLPWTRRLRWSA